MKQKLRVSELIKSRFCKSKTMKNKVVINCMIDDLFKI